MNNIVIKKSMPSQKQPITISNPNSSANGSNSSSGHQPLFIHNEDEYKEYQRQKELIEFFS